MADVRTMTCRECHTTTANAMDIRFRYCTHCGGYRPMDGVVIHEPDEVEPVDEGWGRAPLPPIFDDDLAAARARLRRPSGSPTRKPSDKAPDPPETSTR